MEKTKPGEAPKVTEWDNGDGIYVTYNCGNCNTIKNEHIRPLHKALTEKIAEMDAKRWKVLPASDRKGVFVLGRPTCDPTLFHVGTPEQNKADAEEYAAKLNAREGLS